VSRIAGPKPDKWSTVFVNYYVPNPAEIPGFIKLARDASVVYGYSGMYRQLTPQIRILFDVNPMQEDTGFYITLEAPA
jgi:hypothetical protein